ncbi:uncharacterized protein P884DRAFT_295783 [Thermothelomyces heterothallicus CBS 202.75]|uniref:uncharacterized protein n=1 Tax=Thermothelomyces heterothallicus CBS 202.75 TaxID=1149848 RepID=UPI003742A0E8
MDIPWIALTNSIPSLSWLFVGVFARPPRLLRVRVRQELAGATTVVVDRSCRRIAAPWSMPPCHHATVDVDQLGRKPFLLGACVQEVQRLYNKPLRLPDVWGPDAGAFRPERLIDTPPGEEKRRRGSLIPFGWGGGGEYLCPGRRFAVTEITGLVGAVALLFDVDDVKGVTVPPIRAGFAGCAMADPDWKSSDPPRAVFRRRKGWENAQLRFTV